MSAEEALAAHRALVSAWATLYAKVEGARFEQRPDDLIRAIWPRLPMPPCNGPWVEEDSALAVSALPDAIAEVDAAGEEPWVQSRARHQRAQDVARKLGLTHVERLP